MHRFFAPDLDPGDDSVTLPREEAEHLTRVLRLGIGDAVAVFDGRGHEFRARVVRAERREARVQITDRVQPAAEPAVALTLAQAALKGDKMDDIVRDAVMLGVAAVQPLVTVRTETTVAALTRGARLDRWRRVALASVKQSRRAVLPEIRRPLTLESFLGEPPVALMLMLVEPVAATSAAAAGLTPRVSRRVGVGSTGPADVSEPVGVRVAPGAPDTPSLVESLSALRGRQVPQDAAILVGPEGGWAEAELLAAKTSGARLVTLGERTLRADVAPIAAISVLQFLWGDM